MFLIHSYCTLLYTSHSIQQQIGYKQAVTVQLRYRFQRGRGRLLPPFPLRRMLRTMTPEMTMATIYKTSKHQLHTYRELPYIMTTGLTFTYLLCTVLS